MNWVKKAEPIPLETPDAPEMPEKTVFTFDELDERAKDRVRSKVYENLFLDSYEEDAKRQIEEAGFTDAEFNYSLSSSQGDGVSFTGNVDVPLFRRIHGLEQKYLHLYNVLNVNLRRTSSHYVHSGSVETEYELTDTPEGMTEEDAEKLAQEFVTEVDSIRVDLCKKLEKQGYEEIEYQTSDEAIRESAEANDYKFDAGGNII